MPLGQGAHKLSQQQRSQWVSWPRLRGLLIWNALESRYLKKTMTNDALGNILDALSLRIIKAIRFPFKGESGGAVCDSTPG